MAKKRAPATKKKTTNSKGKTKKKPDSKLEQGAQRLNKVLAGAGLGSRREVEELIVQGRVEVDREVVTDLACKVDPQKVTVKVDGQPIKKFRPVYFILNKPKGVLSTNNDPSGRIRVVDFVPDSERVFSVGRLDKSSEGLMLLTNDGELAQKLAHPSYRVSKTYFVVVSGIMTKEHLEKLHKGVYLAEGFARIDGAKIRKQKKHSTELEITLSEGKNREIRRILAREGHKVVVLRRIAIGSLRLGQLPVGGSRKLTAAEVKALYATTETARKKAKKQKPAKGAKKKGTKKNKSSDSEFIDEGLDDEIIATPMADTGDIVFDSDFTDFDDDFVGGFTGTSEGSVLAYDDEPSPELEKRRSPRGASSKRTKGTRGPKRAASATTKGSRGSKKRVASKGSKDSRGRTNSRGSRSGSKNPKGGTKAKSTKSAKGRGPSKKSSTKSTGRRATGKSQGRSSKASKAPKRGKRR